MNDHISPELRPLAVPISDLALDPRNARKHGEKNLAAIRASLERFGQRKPVVVQREGMVVRAGNGTVEAARSLGWTHIAAVVSDDDDNTATAFALADNRSAELAEWDDEALAELVSELDADMLKAIGFDDDDVSALEARVSPNEVVEDEAPEAPKTPVSRRGDLWVLGKHRLLCGDSTDGADVAIVMDGERAALCFTSPPYADAREYKGADIDVSALSKFISACADFSDIIAVNLGIIRRDNRIVRYWDEYIAEAESAGLLLLSWNIWDRNQPWSMAQNTAMFPIEHEWVFVFGRERKALNLTIENKTPGQRTCITNRNADGTLSRASTKEVRTHRPLGTIFRSPPHIGADIGHPAMFPVALPSEYIKAATQPGDTVSEPFCGSGTTIIAAEQLGRRCYAIEIAPEYVDVAIKRWQRLTGEQATLDGKPWSQVAEERGVVIE